MAFRLSPFQYSVQQNYRQEIADLQELNERKDVRIQLLEQKIQKLQVSRRSGSKMSNEPVAPSVLENHTSSKSYLARGGAMNRVPARQRLIYSGTAHCIVTFVQPIFFTLIKDKSDI